MSLVLETERLRLRLPEVGDAAALAAALDNFNVTRWLAIVPHPYGLADAEQWLGGLPEQPELGRAPLAIDLPGSGLIGVVSLTPYLGYWLAEPYWGHGYMSEAAAALLAWHYGQEAAEDVVTSSTRDDNHGSRNVLRKLGFVETGLEERTHPLRGHVYVAVNHELTRKAFEERER